MKKVLLVLLSVITLITLTGCGWPRGKSVDEIDENVIKNAHFIGDKITLGNYSLIIEKYEIKNEDLIDENILLKDGKGHSIILKDVKKSNKKYFVIVDAKIEFIESNKDKILKLFDHLELFNNRSEEYKKLGTNWLDKALDIVTPGTNDYFINMPAEQPWNNGKYNGVKFEDIDEGKIRIIFDFTEDMKIGTETISTIPTKENGLFFILKIKKFLNLDSKIVILGKDKPAPKPEKSK